MGPIEGLWGSIIVIFVLVGLVRGFLKELGVTTILIVMLFGFDRIIPFLEEFINKGGLLAIGLSPFNLDNPTMQSTTNALWLVFTLLTVLIVFVAYQGETLTYAGNNPRFPVGTLLGLLIGAVNGYLITGTLWWFLDRYHYPVQQLKLIDPTQLTDFAQQILSNKLLPLDLLGNGGSAPASGFGAIWLPLILVVLIVLKVLR
jgi:uncharacterized membrane protein required for colicin V production